jgi:hypothetical protein
MTASSPRGTFSQAELMAYRVITRYITRSMSVPGATIRAIPGDLEPLPARVYPGPDACWGLNIRLGSGPAVRATELRHQGSPGRSAKRVLSVRQGFGRTRFGVIIATKRL